MAERDPGYIRKAFATERHAKTIANSSFQSHDYTNAKFALRVLARDLGHTSSASVPRVIRLPGPQRSN